MCANVQKKRETYHRWHVSPIKKLITFLYEMKTNLSSVRVGGGSFSAAHTFGTAHR